MNYYYYNDVYGCTLGVASGANDGGDNLEEDPLFVDAGAGDLHLDPDSPCIDTGDTYSDYGNEPDPNGCRIKMGAYGNTTEATSADGTSHCP